MSAEPRSDVFLSVAVVIDEGTVDVTGLLRALSDGVAGRYRNYEIVVVDDHLDAEVVGGLRELLHRLPCLRVLRLSRRAAVDTAVFAGLEASIGDVVVTMALTYDAVADVLAVAERIVRGADVVQGLSREPLAGGLATRLGRSAFYAYNRRFLHVDIPTRATYLLGLSRRAVNSLGSARRSQRYVRHLVRHIGYGVEPYEYSMSNATVQRSVARSRGLTAVEMISSYSTHPLRVVALLGVVGALGNLLYAAYVIVVTLIDRQVSEGWPTISLQLSAMFFLISVILAVQAEYVGRILSESRREPLYFVVEEIESDALLAEAGRRNVTHA